MALFKHFFGRSDFEPEKDIQAFIKNSKNFDPNSEDPINSKILLLFKTSKQHTWLVATQERLYCILDDINKNDAPHINWSMSKDQLKANQEILIEITPQENSQKTGLVHIGEQHKNWLYSKSLFEHQSVENMINNLIQWM